MLFSALIPGLHFEPIITAGSVTMIAMMIGAAVIWWIRGMPDRRRAEIEGAALNNAEAALRFKEFRVEVHALRNELGVVRAELHTAQTQSARRGDKLNMVLFILRMVMDELASKEPGNKVLKQAKNLLSRVEDEPHADSQSDALNAACETVEAAEEAVREVKKSEAKK